MDMAEAIGQKFEANGKFLISGEYAILDGAWGLAFPLMHGQVLHTFPATDQHTLWVSKEADGTPWFHAHIHPGTGLVVETDQPEVAGWLENILRAVPDQRRKERMKGQRVEVTASFDRSWGLGSSSTLIALVAKWMGWSPYALLEASFGGSGYDIACAGMDGPLLYRRIPGQEPEVIPVALPDPLLQHIYFVYSGQKMNSRSGIQHYRKHPPSTDWLNQVSQLSISLSKQPEVSHWLQLLKEHEILLSAQLDLPCIADHFPDFEGVLKSMGAWGGDFFLALHPNPNYTKAFFAERGYPHVYSAMDWVKHE
jgi:mevalonate kinase